MKVFEGEDAGDDNDEGSEQDSTKMTKHTNQNDHRWADHAIIPSCTCVVLFVLLVSGALSFRPWRGVAFPSLWVVRVRVTVSVCWSVSMVLSVSRLSVSTSVVCGCVHERFPAPACLDSHALNCHAVVNEGVVLLNPGRRASPEEVTSSNRCSAMEGAHACPMAEKHKRHKDLRTTHVRNDGRYQTCTTHVNGITQLSCTCILYLCCQLVAGA